MINANKEYTFEDVLAMFPEETEKSRIIDNFIEHLKKALEFIKTTEAFKTVDVQRYLRCGYSDTCRVLDTLVLFSEMAHKELFCDGFIELCGKTGTIIRLLNQLKAKLERSEQITEGEHNE